MWGERKHTFNPNSRKRQRVRWLGFSANGWIGQRRLRQRRIRERRIRERGIRERGFRERGIRRFRQRNGECCQPNDLYGFTFVV